MVERVVINGKKYPVFMGTNTMRIYKSTFDGNFLQDVSKAAVLNDDSQPVLDMSIAVNVAYASIADGFRRVSQPFDMTPEDLADQFDEDLDAIGRIFDLMPKFGIFKNLSKEEVKSLGKQKGAN